MADLFRLSDEQRAGIDPFMPRNRPGPERDVDRQVLSGILDVLTTGSRWRGWQRHATPILVGRGSRGQHRRWGGDSVVGFGA